MDESEPSKTLTDIKKNEQPQTAAPPSLRKKLIRPDYPSRTSNALGIFQILVSFVTIGAALLLNIWGDEIGGVGYGYLGAGAAVVTGILGMSAAATKNKILIGLYMVMAFVSMFIVGYMAYYATLGIIVDETSYGHCLMNKPAIVNSGIVITAFMLEISFLASIGTAGGCCGKFKEETKKQTHGSVILHVESPSQFLDTPPSYSDCMDEFALPAKQDLDVESPPPYEENVNNEEALKNQCDC